MFNGEGIILTPCVNEVSKSVLSYTDGAFPLKAIILWLVWVLLKSFRTSVCSKFNLLYKDSRPGITVFHLTQHWLFVRRYSLQCWSVMNLSWNVKQWRSACRLLTVWNDVFVQTGAFGDLPWGCPVKQNCNTPYSVCSVVQQEEHFTAAFLSKDCAKESDFILRTPRAQSNIKSADHISYNCYCLSTITSNSRGDFLLIESCVCVDGDVCTYSRCLFACLWPHYFLTAGHSTK